MGLGRMRYNAGLIGMKPFKLDQSNPMGVIPANIRLGSFKEERAKIDHLVNSVLIYYDKHNYDEEHEGKIEVDDPDSISRYQLREQRFNFSLIRTESTAQFVADWILQNYGQPMVLLSFTTYLNAFPVEKNDVFYFVTKFAGWALGRGKVLTRHFTFGSGKNEQINSITFTLQSPESFLKNPVLADKITFREELDLSRGGEILEAESIEYVETVVAEAFEPKRISFTEKIEYEDSDRQTVGSGYGNAGYGETGYGT
jgi:hypothetical protein